MLLHIIGEEVIEATILEVITSQDFTVKIKEEAEAIIKAQTTEGEVRSIQTEDQEVILEEVIKTIITKPAKILDQAQTITILGIVKKVIPNLN